MPTQTAHDLVGQVVDGSILNEINCPPGTIVVRVPRPDNGVPHDVPTWRGENLWRNPTSSAKIIESDARFLVLYAPFVQVGDTVKTLAQINALPALTVLIDDCGFIAQSWIDDVDGIEALRWSLTGYSDGIDADELLTNMTAPVIVLRLPEES